MSTPVLAALLLIPLPVLISIIINRIRTASLRSQQQHPLPPSPPRLPLVGNLHQLSSLPHQSLHALSNKHGPLMLLMLGRAPTLVVSSADAAREIMRSHDRVFASRPPIKAARIIFYGGRDVIFSPYGEYWRQLKSLCVNHLLNPKMVQSFRGLHRGEVASMVSKISETPGVINLSEVLNSFVNKLMCRVLFGDYIRDDGSFRSICKLIEDSSVVLGQFSVADCIPSLGWLDKLSGFEARAAKIFRKWDALLEEIIEDRGKRSGAKGEDNASFIDVLIALQKDEGMEPWLTREVVKAVLLDMVAAGTDTTFITLDWCMAELVRNPETMKKLREEIERIAGAGSAVREEHLSEMSYLKAVIKEALRLHPPVPMLLPRESMERCSVQGYEIPKQTRVLVNAWAIGRDPKTWEEPEEFRPERFLGSSRDYRGNHFEFTPFGAGRRMCPGIQFATATMELALANLVNKFDWGLPDGAKREDLDMAEAPGISTRRLQRLCLVAQPLKT